MAQKILLTLEIDGSALDAAQAKADKLIATLKEAEALTEALENAVAIDCDDFAEMLAAVKALTKEKPPEGGNSCSGKGVLDPVLLRKAQERVDARKRGSDDSVDVLCATLDKVIRGVARDIFKPPN